MLQCPRCGLLNSPDVTACARCALPVTLPPPQQGGQPEGQQGGQPDGRGDEQYTQRIPTGYPQPGQQTSQQPGYEQSPYPQAPYQQPTQPRYDQAGYGPGAAATAGPAPYQQQGYGETGYLPVGGYGTTAVAEPASGSRGALVARVLLGVAAVACLIYALWALTARRSVFADFADNQVVTLARARSSDHTDTVLLVLAGVLAVIALICWLIQVLTGRAREGGLPIAGFVVSGVGLVCVVVGLVMSGMVADSGTRAEQGQRAVTATLVTGTGFLILAVGLVIGVLAATGSDPERQPSDDRYAYPAS